MKKLICRGTSRVPLQPNIIPADPNCMLILTNESLDFSKMLALFHGAETIGSYSKNGLVHVVKAADRYLLISPDAGNLKIAIKPVKEARDAIRMALQFLKREEKRGSVVTFAS